MKTAKITEIWKKKSFESQRWTKRNIKIKLDDGTEWSIIKDKEDSLKVGDEISYETEETEYGLRIKQKNTGRWWYSKWNSDKTLIICKAMECAVRMVACGDVKQEDIEKYFNRFYDIMNKKNGE